MDHFTNDASNKTLNFIQKSQEIHGNTYNYSKVNYKNCDLNVIIICKMHGEFLQTPYTHLHSNGCKKCGYENLKLKKLGNTEDFIKKSKLKHNDKYDYSKVVYKNAKSHVTIICKIHGEFIQTPDKHLQGGCKKCGINSATLKQRGNTEEFIKKAIKIHGDIYNYSKLNYISCYDKVVIICKIHGEFLQQPASHIQGNGCKKCGTENAQLKQADNTETFIKKAVKIHGDIYNYSKLNYINTNKKIIIICEKHGDFLQQPNNHLQGQGCNKCGTENAHLKQTDNTETFIKKAVKIHGDKYNYSKVNYIKSVENVIITCKIHGDFYQIPSTHLSGCGCSKCTMRYSKKAINYLNFISKFNDIYIQHAENDKEYLIPNTKYKADGYCISTNTIYEFHGTIYHGDPRLCNPNECNYLKQKYGDLYKKTIEREKLITSLGYKLVVMWEYDWNKINISIKTFQKKYRCYTKCIKTTLSL